MSQLNDDLSKNIKLSKQPLFNVKAYNYIENKRKKRKLPLRFLGMILLHIADKRRLSLKQAFLIWHTNRNNKLICQTIDCLLTKNTISPQCFLYRIKSFCRNYKKNQIIQNNQNPIDFNSVPKLQFQTNLFQSLKSVDLEMQNHVTFRKNFKTQITEQPTQRLKSISKFKETDYCKLEKLENTVNEVETKFKQLSLKILTKSLLQLFERCLLEQAFLKIYSSK